jgi:hypothetical protein
MIIIMIIIIIIKKCLRYIVVGVEIKNGMEE